MFETIYHGSNTKYLDKILKKGICPRGTKGKTNWKKYPSHPDMVYMSTCYPFYFSYCSQAERKEKAVVFEIDFSQLDPDLLYPDEDFIWHCLPKDGRPSVIEIRKDIDSYKQFWLKSLENLGNICYRGIILPQWIKRYCIVDFSHRTILGMRALDPSISVLNHRFCGKDYEHMTKWFFGDVEFLPEVENNKFILETDPECPESMKDITNKKIEFWTKESKDRTGIEVKEFIHERTRTQIA